MEPQFLSSLLLAGSGEFGINTNILETNLVNQLILAGGLFVIGRDFLNESLSQRQTEIITNVQNSEKRLAEASTRLAEAKKQLSQAKLIMEDIRKETRKPS
uniref:ATP synthase CF0 B subunit n=1 Tax=Rhizochromulina marina TaxID=1034831 RepID=A0A514CPY3_9STRA|nr:ATP synthase CF0 B subunit [Rhizochromulina marina]QDH81868.1 ATP synthase CF0 B subunit [Rhizochromulina marina]